MITSSLLLFAFVVNAEESPAEPNADRHLPPAFPIAPEPEPDDCLRAYDVVPDKTPGFWLNGSPTCRGTLLPTWQTKDWLSRMAWGAATRDYYEIEVAVLTAERDYARLQVEEVRPKWYQRPLPVAIVASGFTILVGYVAVQAWTPN